MKFGPFVCLPGSLAVVGIDGVDSWELHAQELFNMQKNVPWWLGDLVVFGEARFGDDFWQTVPEDIDLSMLQRFAKVASLMPPADRIPELSWTHHSIALKIKDTNLRNAALQMALKKCMDTKEFGKYIERYV